MKLGYDLIKFVPIVSLRIGCHILETLRKIVSKWKVGLLLLVLDHFHYNNSKRDSLPSIKTLLRTLSLYNIHSRELPNRCITIKVTKGLTRYQNLTLTDFEGVSFATCLGTGEASDLASVDCNLFKFGEPLPCEKRNVKLVSPFKRKDNWN